jgi:hypothetical protein
MERRRPHCIVWQVAVARIEGGFGETQQRADVVRRTKGRRGEKQSRFMNRLLEDVWSRCHFESLLLRA